jgi:hypothetical protein
MARERKKDELQNKSGRTIKDNVGDIFRCIGLFFDVATLMPRMLFNVIVYDTPSGKHEMQYEGSSSAREGTRNR